jgi:hypothetical protein
MTRASRSYNMENTHYTNHSGSQHPQTPNSDLLVSNARLGTPLVFYFIAFSSFFPSMKLIQLKESPASTYRGLWHRRALVPAVGNQYSPRSDFNGNFATLNSYFKRDSALSGRSGTI